MQRQYYTAVDAVKLVIVPEWLQSFCQLFQWCFTAIPLERTEWINEWIDDGIISHPMPLFCERMKDLLKFHHLKLVFHFQTNTKMCESDEEH
jgi:hypothetical protein